MAPSRFLPTRFASAARPIAAVAMLLLATGCSSTGMVSTGLFHRKSIPTADAAHPPVRMLSMWHEAEGRGADGAQTRGFAGQIYFFTRNSEEPVAVDGDVRVYLFDDQGSQDEQARPIHQFDFVDGAWQHQLDESQFGVVYNVFVPYTRSGRYEANCALRVRLTTPDGGTLFSELTAVKLSGATRAKEEPAPATVKLDRPSLSEYQLREVSPQQRHPEQIRGTTIGMVQSGDRFQTMDRYQEHRGTTDDGTVPASFGTTRMTDSRIASERARVTGSGIQQVSWESEAAPNFEPAASRFESAPRYESAAPRYEPRPAERFRSAPRRASAADIFSTDESNEAASAGSVPGGYSQYDAGYSELVPIHHLSRPLSRANTAHTEPPRIERREQPEFGTWSTNDDPAWSEDSLRRISMVRVDR